MNFLLRALKFFVAGKTVVLHLTQHVDYKPVCCPRFMSFLATRTRVGSLRPFIYAFFAI